MLQLMLDQVVDAVQTALTENYCFEADEDLADLGLTLVCSYFAGQRRWGDDFVYIFEGPDNKLIGVSLYKMSGDSSGSDELNWVDYMEPEEITTIRYERTHAKV